MYGRKVEVGNDWPPRRRPQSPRRVEGGRELTAVDEAIDPRGIVALGLGHGLQFRHIAPHGVDEIGEVERQQPGVGHPQRRAAGDLGHHHAVHVPRVGETFVVLHRVVERVVAAALSLAADGHVGGGDTHVMQKRRVVRTGAKG